MTEAKEQFISLVQHADTLEMLHDVLRVLRDLMPPAGGGEGARNLRKQVTLLRARIKDAEEVERLGLRSQSDLREYELQLAKQTISLSRDVTEVANTNELQTCAQSLSLSMAARDRTQTQERRGGQIFLSYRRTDSATVTGRIRERLVEAFGRETVFFDVDSIPLGANFRAYIVSTLAECRACLAVVGPGWIDACNANGERRLDDFEDPIRIELETAMRIDRPVIPLLVSNATMPDRNAVPDSLRGFCSMNGFPVRPDPDFDNDISRLISRLQDQIL